VSQFQGLSLLFASAVAGAVIAKIVMAWLGKYINPLFRHRKLSFEIDSPLSTVVDRLGALAEDEFSVPESKQKYRVSLLPDNAFVFEPAATRFNNVTPSIRGWLSEEHSRTTVNATVQLSLSTVTNALAVVPAVWVLFLLQWVFSDMWQNANAVWLLALVVVVLPLLLVGFLRMMIHINEDDWQRHVNIFDSIICGSVRQNQTGRSLPPYVSPAGSR